MELDSTWITWATWSSCALTVYLSLTIIILHIRHRRRMTRMATEMEEMVMQAGIFSGHQLGRRAAINSILKPTDFGDFPNEPVIHSADDRGMAWKIIRILMSSGNDWRVVTWEEFLTHHAGDYTKWDSFERVIRYCTSAERAQTFCREWSRDAFGDT